ncbi:MAG: TetR/AcrR family transcriptional regulator, partial [Phototrophicaceae bacterium]|jgi:AcrR family transcriptional regulator
MSESPRERRQEKTRQAILDAALDIISEKGALNLSLREIARRIDYSPAGLYEYFAGKDEIIQAVCDNALAQLRDYLLAVDLALPLPDYLIEIGLAYVQYAKDHPQQFLFFFVQGVDLLEEDTAHPYTLDEDETIQIVDSAVQRGIESGQIRADDRTSLEIGYGLWAIAHGAAMLQIRYIVGEPLNFPRADRILLETYVRALFV